MSSTRLLFLTARSTTHGVRATLDLQPRFVFQRFALRARGAGFLPAYDHVILDEAHAVEDVACEQFGTSLAEGSVRHLVRVLHDSRRGRAFLDTLELKEGRESARVSAVQAVQRLAEAAEQFFDAWERWGQQAEANGRIRAPGVVPDTLTRPLAN